MWSTTTAFGQCSSRRTLHELTLSITTFSGSEPPNREFKTAPDKPTISAPTRWPQPVKTAIHASTSKDAYVVDTIQLPSPNPWHRGFRPADIQFLPDGTGVLVTIDGDIWLARGLTQGSDRGTLEAIRFRSPRTHDGSDSGGPNLRL